VAALLTLYSQSLIAPTWPPESHRLQNYIQTRPSSSYHAYSYTVVRSADRGKLLLTTATIGTWFRANHPDAGRSSIDFLVLKEASAINLRLLLREYYSEPFSTFLTSPEAVLEGPGGAGWCRLASVSGTVALTHARGFAGLPLLQIQRFCSSNVLIPSFLLRRLTVKAR